MALASTLSADQRWCQAIAEVPRHLFAPDHAWAMQGSGPGHAIDSTADRPEWLRQVYAADTAIIIQRDDGTARADEGTGIPTSSLSAPDVVVRFLQLLDVRDGDTILEIGTGSGWTAGLLSHRLGDDHVTTVEVDEQLAARATQNLMAAGEVQVSQYGDRSLWSEAEDTYAAWLRAGCPPQARFGLTISPSGQHVWLDKPEHIVPT